MPRPPDRSTDGSTSSVLLLLTGGRCLSEVVQLQNSRILLSKHIRRAHRYSRRGETVGDSPTRIRLEPACVSNQKPPEASNNISGNRQTVAGGVTRGNPERNREADDYDERSSPNVPQLQEGISTAAKGTQSQSERPSSQEYSVGANVTSAANDIARDCLRTISPQTATPLDPEESNLHSCRGRFPREITKDNEKGSRQLESSPENMTRASHSYERTINSRLAEVGYGETRGESRWIVFVEWAEMYSIMPVRKSQLESLVSQVYDVDVWDHLQEQYGLERGSLEEVLGNDDWFFLISSAAEGRLIYGLDMENLDLCICGNDWNTAYETTLTFWSRKENMRPLIHATSHNRDKYQQGWRPVSKEGYVDGVPSPREYT